MGLENREAWRTSPADAVISRRRFCADAASVALFAAAGCMTRPPACGRNGGRWYKGNLHCHSYWSDGRAFPDQAIRSYRDAGYDFCAVTDHNRLGESRDFWRKVEPDEGGWPPLVCRRNFELYRKEFPWAESRESNGVTEVRLQTMSELIGRYSVPGRFLVMRGMEITRYGADVRHMHMNYVNLDGAVPGSEEEQLVQAVPDGLDSARSIRHARKQVAVLAKSLGNPPRICFLNHPHWRYYDVVAQDIIDNPEVRFFEVCNNGSDFAPVIPLPDDGLYNDRLWDAVNAVRSRAGEPLLYAVANDDCHFYPCTRTKKTCTFGESYTVVRAEELTPAALFAAMDRGDFYASCGVDLEDIWFDGRTLGVSVPAKKDVAHTVRFIVTKRGANLGVVQTVSIPRVSEGDLARRPPRTVPVYSPDVGATAKSVVGGKGERLVCEYSLAADDLYVRARIESDERAPYYAFGGKGAMHPKVAMAWTQPYAKA